MKHSLHALLFLLCALLLVLPVADAQELLQRGERPPSSQIYQFYKALLQGNSEGAFRNLLRSGPLAKREDAVRILHTQFLKATQVYGEMKGYEFIDSVAVTPSLCKIRYLTLHPQHPLQWSFFFYQSPIHGWIVLQITFNDRIMELFDRGEQ